MPGTAFASQPVLRQRPTRQRRSRWLAAVAAGREGDRRRTRAAVPPGHPAGGVRLDRRHARRHRAGRAGARVIIEKPFGTDLASARALNQTVHAVFDESQVFRIDHFLGKESVDNILAFRFANGLFEPIWNRDHIALRADRRARDAVDRGPRRVLRADRRLPGHDRHPPVPGAGVRGHGAADLAGRQGTCATRRSRCSTRCRPLDLAHVVRGQYDGYRPSPAWRRSSETETFAAVRAEVDNWRWAGVPFFLRSGKAWRPARQVITLGFQRAAAADVPGPPPTTSRPGGGNEIVIDFADPGSITASFLAKEPGAADEPRHRRDDVPLRGLVRRRSTGWRATSGSSARRHARRPVAVHPRRRRSSGCGRSPPPLLEHPPPVQPYAPGSWGPDSVAASWSRRTTGTCRTPRRLRAARLRAQ